MIAPPVALGLTLCLEVIVEEHTKNVSLINSFFTWKVAGFPSIPRPFFCAFAVLRDGQGSGTIEFVITRADTDEVVYSFRRPVQFTNPLTEARATFRINDCSFPAAGLYYATLSVDNEWVAQRRFEVSLLGGKS